jgi:thiol-disulfide isomerase/thioredoxin
MKSILLLLVSFLIFSGCKQKQPPAASPAEDPSYTENTTTEDPFSGTNLVDHIELFDLDDNPIDLKSYRGKRIFLNFWATWCKPCILEMPSIERAQQLLAEDDYVFLLASDEGLGKINRFRATQDFSLNFIQVKTPFPDMGILSLPTTMIIDEQGRIVMNQIGAVEWDAPEILNKLRSLNM